MDGTLGSSTAWMLDGSGMVLTSAAEMAEIARASAASGLSVAVHAIGDGANRAVLDALEETRAAWEELPVPPRIEHVQCIDDADLGRLAEMGVTASMQPVHQRSDRDIADRLWGERARCGYRWRDLLDSGASLAFGSDAPIEDLDPAGRDRRRGQPRLVSRPAARGRRRRAGVHGGRARTRSASTSAAASSCPATRPTWSCSTPTSSPTRTASPTPRWWRRCWRAAGSTAARPGDATTGSDPNVARAPKPLRFRCTSSLTSLTASSAYGRRMPRPHRPLAAGLDLPRHRPRATRRRRSSVTDADREVFLSGLAVARASRRPPLPRLLPDGEPLPPARRDAASEPRRRDAAVERHLCDAVQPPPRADRATCSRAGTAPS